MQDAERGRPAQRNGMTQSCSALLPSRSDPHHWRRCRPHPRPSLRRRCAWRRNPWIAGTTCSAPSERAATARRCWPCAVRTNPRCAAAPERVVSASFHPPRAASLSAIIALLDCAAACRHAQLQVVVKQIWLKDVDDLMRQEALKEAQLLARFDHVNIVHYHECILEVRGLWLRAHAQSRPQPPAPATHPLCDARACLDRRGSASTSSWSTPRRATWAASSRRAPRTRSHSPRTTSCSGEAAAAALAKGLAQPTPASTGAA